MHIQTGCSLASWCAHHTTDTDKDICLFMHEMSQQTVAHMGDILRTWEEFRLLLSFSVTWTRGFWQFFLVFPCYERDCQLSLISLSFTPFSQCSTTQHILVVVINKTTCHKTHLGRDVFWTLHAQPYVFEFYFCHNLRVKIRWCSSCEETWRNVRHFGTASIQVPVGRRREDIPPARMATRQEPVSKITDKISSG